MKRREYNLKLDAGQYGYFYTEWATLFDNTLKRNVDKEVKEVIAKMYASLLLQLEEQNLKYYKDIKTNKDFNDFYTEELIDRFIVECEKAITTYKNYVK